MSMVKLKPQQVLTEQEMEHNERVHCEQSFYGRLTTGFKGE